MRVQSAKAKGRRLQQYLRDKLLEYAQHLTVNDIRSTSMGAPGEDLLLSEAALKTYPFGFECKNQEKLNIWDALEQAKDNAKDKTPLLCFKRNHSDTYVALPLEAFLKLMRRDNETK